MISLLDTFSSGHASNRGPRGGGGRTGVRVNPIAKPAFVSNEVDDASGSAATDADAFSGEPVPELDPADSGHPPVVTSLAPPIFAPDGWMHQALHLRHRPQQAALANVVAKAFSADTSLLCEAGTGVGKSLAYLLPGLIHAIDSGRQLVVSTHTIPLQEQIQNNDLVKCRALFEAVPALGPYANFKTALLVGKANYLCGTRLAKALQNHSELLESTQQGDLRIIQDWSTRTQSGLREDLPVPVSHEVWDWVNADSSLCNRRNCSPETCPYQRARERIAEASLVIVNHALLLSLIAAGMAPKGGAKGVLFANDFVVLDEAHRLPDVATDHFGATVTAVAIERQLKMLWNQRRDKGLLAAYNKDADKRLVAEVHTATEVFFNIVRATFLEGTPIWRQRNPNWAEPLLHDPIARLCARLKDLSKLETNNDRRGELTDVARRLAALNSALDDAISLGEAPDYVYWVERGGAKGRNVSVNSAPLDVADLLRQNLFERKTSVVLTSATLTDSPGSMNRFQKRTGSASIPTHIEASPFDYRRNMEIYIAADAPKFSGGDDNGWRDAADSASTPPRGARDDATSFSGIFSSPTLEWQTAVCAHGIRAVPGGTLLLCTSHGDVRRLHAALSHALKDDEASPARRILAQLPGTSRAALVREFREAGNAVLIGTDSFWTGVDVPGAALSQVILLRLPFENPSHPIVEARTEWLEGRGLSPFGEMSLPAALIKFRQGIGRLIRTMNDRGRLLILDSRVLTKTYGRHFVAALPHSRFTRFRRATLAEDIPPYQ
ncbi:MAG: ATP-dependent DNA helicase [Puniceicoccales bacterium]|nr:ATP-dependent DNA helicase [Puniceicoccales bacterium]